MRNVKLIIAYDGTNYHGWQRQLEEIITVEQITIKAIAEVVGHSVKLRASGRTDQGVHALGQVVNFFTDTPIPSGRLFRVINNHLPDDIRIIHAQDVSDDFDANLSARSKLYRYTVYNHFFEDSQGGWELPGARRFAYRYPPTCDIDRMKEAANLLLGEHDFASFAASTCQRKTTVRTLLRCQVWRKYHYIYLDVEGTGFLHFMVRNIVGTLLDIGRGHRQPGSIKEILAAKDRCAAGPRAPANGLCLRWVRY